MGFILLMLKGERIIKGGGEGGDIEQKDGPFAGSAHFLKSFRVEEDAFIYLEFSDKR